MKWLVFLALLAVIPFLTALFRMQPRLIVHACFLMGLLLFFVDPYLNIGPYTWHWAGLFKGIDLTIVDVIAIAVMFATRPVRVPLLLKAAFLIYVAALVVSTLAAQQWIPTTFYSWQFLRAVLVFIAVARASATVKGAPIALAAGLGAGIVFESILATKQYLGGNSQPGGSLGHRNLLGLTSHFAVMPAFALLLAGRRSLGAALVVLAGVTIALVGGSRATIGFMAVGLAITTALSIRHKMTGRKAGMAAAAAIACAVLAPAMYWSVERRPEAVRLSSDQERAAMTEAARMIIADYPLGVGANHYLVVANVGGYSGRAGVAWNEYNRSAPVHNSYYLVAAELSILGLLGMCAILLSVIWVGLRSMRHLGGNERSELLVGLLAALIVVSGHLAFEWLFMTVYLHYLLAMNMGALVGIAATVVHRSSSPRQRRFPATDSGFAPVR